MTVSYETLSKERKKLQKEGLLPDHWSTASWQLFKEKYLFKADNPREQYERIAHTLAVHTPDPELWKQKFFDLMWKGWLSPSTPILSNTGTNRGLPVSCLTGDSLLNTRSGGVKPIKDIEIGDEVLTHKGRWRKVTAKQSRETENDLYELKVDTRTTPIRITGNHPVLTNVGWVRVDELNPKEHFIATNGQISYEEKDCVINLYEFKNKEDFHHSTHLPDPVTVTPELAWAIGLWFAEGSLCRKGDTHGRSVRVTMAPHEEDVAREFGEVMRKYFGVNYTFYRSDYQGRSWVNCNVNSKVLADYFGDKFGTSCLTKTIPTDMLEMPKENLKELLRGIYDGDGRKSSGNRKDFTPDIRLSNEKLISQVYELCLKIGEKVSYTVNLKKDSTRNPYGVVTFHKKAKGEQLKKRNVFRGVMFQDGNRYCKFNLTKIDQNETVYDITVEEDHSFSVCGVVVHNCAGSYFPDSINGIYKAKHEVAILTKHGFGTAGYMGDIRPRGASVSNGYKSSGVLPVIEGMEKDMEYVAQG